MIARVRWDPIHTDRALAYPVSPSPELHHIYPKEWCRNNRAGELAEVLDPEHVGSDPSDAVANLMPLSRESNNAWRQKLPAQYIREADISFNPSRAAFESLFIDQKGFALLEAGPRHIAEFWRHRADLIAKHLLLSTTIYFD